jgi:hypothetical protein
MIELSLGDVQSVCNAVLSSGANKELSQDDEQKSGGKHASTTGKVTTTCVESGADAGDTHLDDLVCTKCRCPEARGASKHQQKLKIGVMSPHRHD